MTVFHHNGLYFSEDAVQRAEATRGKAPFKEAFAALAAYHADEPLVQAVTCGFRYQFNGDDAAGTQATVLLAEHGAGFNQNAEKSFVEACMATVAIAHAFEMVRGLFDADEATAWLQRYEAQTRQLIDTDESKLPLEARVWRTAVRIVGGIVLDDETQFVLGTEDFRQIVDSGIHPEGYMPEIVERKDGNALWRQLVSAKGLVLAAEAASHQGTNLWEHEMRGISAKTAAIYAAAYYEYRDQWQWDTPPDETANEAMYRAHGGFFEMLNTQLRPEVLKSTLEAMRPVIDVYGGGFTTLSHGQQVRRGFFGLGG